ncbi:nuclear transcription factor Y subunit alpha isoform X11 [Lutra lutra]|uniref:nuclear transcription factor Y subunit alpha isoform X11 n=1 Tax=Lutra lutra TaxID=9657 RepID=UPI001FD141CA|nr:nuclear transcription factor Y subunit alpha isoform X11 [Lutra lutra]
MFRAVFEFKDLARLEGACVFLQPAMVSNQGSGRGFRARLRGAPSTGGGASPMLGLGGVVSEAPARRRLEGGPIPLCSGSPFCEAAAVAAAAAAGASDWVSGSGTGANQRGQRTGGARHGSGAAINGTGQWRPINHINWPAHHGPSCPWWTRSNHHASTCVWDSGFAADTVGPTWTDSDPGWAGCAGTGPAGPDPADHHSAAPDSSHCWPDPDPAADCCPGTASGTDCRRANHCLSASECRWHHSTTRHDHHPSSQLGRSTDRSDRSQHQHNQQWARDCHCDTTSGRQCGQFRRDGHDGARCWLSTCYPKNPSPWGRDARRRASLCERQAVPPYIKEEASPS